MAAFEYSVYKTAEEQEAFDFYKINGVQRRVEYPPYYRKYTVRLPPTPKADGSVTLNEPITITSKNPTTLEAIMYDEQFKCERNHPDGSAHKEENNNLWSQTIPAALPMALMYGQVEEVVVKINFPSVSLRGGEAEEAEEAEEAISSTPVEHVEYDEYTSGEEDDYDVEYAGSVDPSEDGSFSSTYVEVDQVSYPITSTKHVGEAVLTSAQVEQGTSASANQFIETVLPSAHVDQIEEVSSPSPKECVENVAQSTEVDQIEQVSSPSINQVIDTARSSNELGQGVASSPTSSQKAATVDLLQTKQVEVEQIVAQSTASASPQQITPKMTLAKTLTIPLSLDVRNQQWPFAHPDDMDIDDGRKWTVGHIDWIPGGIRKFYTNYPGGYAAFHKAVAATGKGFFTAPELKTLIAPALKQNQRPAAALQGRSASLNTRVGSAIGVGSNNGIASIKGASVNGNRSASGVTPSNYTTAKGIEKAAPVKSASLSPNPIPPHLRGRSPPVAVNQVGSPNDVASPPPKPLNGFEKAQVIPTASTISSCSPTSSPKKSVEKAQGSPAAFNNVTSSANSTPKERVERAPISPVGSPVGSINDLALPSTSVPKQTTEKVQSSPLASIVSAPSSSSVGKAQVSPAINPPPNSVPPHFRGIYKSVQEMEAALAKNKNPTLSTSTSSSTSSSPNGIPPHLRGKYKSVQEMEAALAKAKNPTLNISNYPNKAYSSASASASTSASASPKSIPPHLRGIYKSVEEKEAALAKANALLLTVSNCQNKAQVSTSASGSGPGPGHSSNPSPPKSIPPHLRGRYKSVEEMEAALAKTKSTTLIISKDQNKAQVSVSTSGPGPVHSSGPSPPTSVPPRLRRMFKSVEEMMAAFPYEDKTSTLTASNYQDNSQNSVSTSGSDPGPCSSSGSSSSKSIPPHLRHLHASSEKLQNSKPNPSAAPTVTNKLDKIEDNISVSYPANSVPPHLRHRYKSLLQVGKNPPSAAPTTIKKLENVEENPAPSPSTMKLPPHLRHTQPLAENPKDASYNTTPSYTPTQSKQIEKIEVNGTSSASTMKLPPHLRHTQPLVEDLKTSSSNTTQANGSLSASIMKLPPHLRHTRPLVEDLKTSSSNNTPSSVPTQSKKVEEVEFIAIPLSAHSSENMNVISTNTITLSTSTPAKKIEKVEITGFASAKPLCEHSAEHVKFASANSIVLSTSTLKEIDISEVTELVSHKSLSPIEHSTEQIKFAIANGTITSTSTSKEINSSEVAEIVFPKSSSPAEHSAESIKIATANGTNISEVTELVSQKPSLTTKHSAEDLKVASTKIAIFSTLTSKEIDISEVAELASPKPLRSKEHSAEDVKNASPNTPFSASGSSKNIENIESRSVACPSLKQLLPNIGHTQSLGDITNSSASTIHVPATRPKTTDTVARRMIGAALGMKLPQKTDETSLAVETVLRPVKQITTNTQVGGGVVEESLEVEDRDRVTISSKKRARVPSPWSSPHLNKVMTAAGLRLLNEQRQLIEMMKYGENYAGEIDLQEQIIDHLEAKVEADANLLGATATPRYGYFSGRTIPPNVFEKVKIKKDFEKIKEKIEKLEKAIDHIFSDESEKDSIDDL